MAGRTARRLPPRRPGDRAACRGEGGGVPVRPLPQRRHHPRAGDEIHRRGDGPRLQLRARLRQVAARRRRASCRMPARCSSRCKDADKKGLAGAGSPAGRDGLPHPGDPRHRRAHPRGGPARRAWSTRCWKAGRIASMRSAPARCSLWSTPPRRPQSVADSFAIRRSALTHVVPHYTTMAGARAAVHAIAALRAGTLEVAPLQSYFRRSF